MSKFRCLNDTPCIYCRHLNRVMSGHIYCKKHEYKLSSVGRLNELTSCGNFRPKKGIKFCLFKLESLARVSENETNN